MISIREQVLAAFDEAVHGGLAADGGAPVTRLERARQRAIDDGARPAVLVIAGGEERVQGEATGLDEYRATVEIWGYVKASGTENIETVLNGLYGRVVKAATADLNLGGLADDVRLLAMEHDLTAQQDTRVADFRAEFLIEYATAEGDPFARP